ncbi:MAG: ABC transporter ATP-binding protein [Thermoanaerobaculia bacterium]|nr:ABC transporter ATP-binding protein [Thermoanaerobaculia bacterium]
MTDPVVQFHGVSKRYSHFLLQDVDLELPRGGIMGFIGPNGAGKSTVIRILMGLVRPDRGEVRVLGQDIPKGQVQAKRDIGFGSEDLRLYRQTTLDWHMEFVRSIYPSWDQSYADTLLRRFDLKRDQKVKGFSHGQRVKAALLLVLARRPKLLVLDEPTTGLDPVARAELLDELMEVVVDDDRSILFSSHNTLDVEQISDYITFIDRGRILATDDKETFLDRWRRLRLELPPETVLPNPPGVVSTQRQGHLCVVTTNQFEPETPSLYSAVGATVTAVEPLTLEEIFIATVRTSREVQPS